MNATVEVEGPEFEDRSGGATVFYRVTVTEDGETVREEEVGEYLADLPDDLDEAASIVRGRVDRLADRLRARYADQGKEEALRARLAAE